MKFMNFNTKRKGKIRPIIYTAALTAALAVSSFVGTTALAEGSRDITRTSRENAQAVKGTVADSAQAGWSVTAGSGEFMGVKTQQKFKFYAFKGERVYIGSSDVDGTNDVLLTLPNDDTQKINLTGTAGKIADTTQEANGPNGVIMEKDGSPVTGGYEPYIYEVKQSGIYTVEFYASGTLSAESDYKRKLNQGFKKNKVTVQAYDITVAQTREDGSIHGVTGRVWMDALSMQTSGDVYGYLYTVTRDGYIWKFGLNGMQPYTFAMYANSRGNIGSGTNASAYHSVHSPIHNYTEFEDYKNLKDKYGNPDGVYLLGPDNEKTEMDSPNHMFFNEPDKNMPNDVILSTPQPMGKIKSVYYDGRDITESEDIKKNIDGYAGVGGQFVVDVDGATAYRIVIDMSNMFAKKSHPEGEVDNDGTAEDRDKICLSTEDDKNFIYYNEKEEKWYSIQTNVNNDRHPSNFEDGEIQPISEYVEDKPITDITGDPTTEATKKQLDKEGYKSLGVIMLGNAAVEEENRIKWDGRDQYGRLLPIGEYFGDTGKGTVYAEPKMGEVHFPLGDVENITEGVSAYLVNAPEGMSEADRSKVYYNNSEKSLLRDFIKESTRYDGNAAKKQGNNTWFWNCPNKSSVTDVGLNKASQSDILDLHWYNNTDTAKKISFDDQFVNASIDGEVSYTGGKPNGTAAVVASNGVDHGVFDVWTYVSGGDKVELENKITLNNLDNQKIITGFVFRDTTHTRDSKGDVDLNAVGVYNKGTDDRELEGADVTVSYGKKKNIESTIMSALTGDNEPYTQTVKTKNNGYYSIPIDMRAFDEDDPKKTVTITVEYHDPKAPDVVTDCVTTIDKTGVDSGAQSLGETDKTANKCIQTIDLAKDGTDKIKKEFYAGDVGFINNPTTKTMKLTTTWSPELLADDSANAEYEIIGITDDAWTKNSTLKGIYKEGAASWDEADIKALKEFFEEEKTYRAYYEDDIISNKGVSSLIMRDSLPTTTLKIADGESTVYSHYETDKQIDYAVFYTGADADKVKISSYADNSWSFVVVNEPAALEETVWYDVNHNGKQDPGEPGIDGADVQIAKWERSQGSQYSEAGYPSTFKRVEENSDATGLEDKWNTTTIAKTYTFSTNNKGELLDSDDKVGIDGLVPGDYRITVTLPAGYSSVEGSATATTDGITTSAVGEVTSSSVGNVVTQYVTIPASNKLKLSTAVTNSGGISIRKDVTYDASLSDSKSFINDKEFNFELHIAGKHPAIGEGSTTEEVEVEKFKTDENNVEYQDPTDSHMTLKFNYDATITHGDVAGVSVAKFKLKPGERIVVAGLPAETQYWVWENDNTTATNGDKSKDSTTYMPNGFSLFNSATNTKLRSSKIPTNLSTLLINYLNQYVPDSVTANAGSGGGTGTSLDVTAKVKISEVDGSKYVWEDGDEFMLSLEPYAEEEGSEAPAFSNPLKSVEVTSGYTAGNDITLNFDSASTTTFTKAGTYKYVLREVKPFGTENIDPIPGITYSDEEYKLEVTVKDNNGEGNLKIDPTDIKWYKKDGTLISPSEIVFNNTYNLSRPTVQLQGTKILNGRKLNEKEFQFKIEAAGSRDLSKSESSFTGPNGLTPGETTVYNSGEATDNITFDAITFNEAFAGEDEASAKIYQYNITEVTDSPLPKGVTGDGHVETVYIRVYKEIVTGTDGQYRQEVRASQCTKDGDPASGFSFTNTYTAEKLDLYLGNKKGIESLNADVMGLTLQKQIEPEEGVVDERKFKEGDTFEFELVPTGDAPAAAGSITLNIDSGSIYKDKTTAQVNLDNVYIPFTKANSDENPYYEYTLRELNPYSSELEAIPGISYSGASYTIRVYVTDDTANGKLALDTKKGGGDGIEIVDKTGDDKTVTFTNKYNPNKIEVPLSATKVLTGSQLSRFAPFEFKLTPVESFDLSKGSGTAGKTDYASGNMPMPAGGRADGDSKIFTNIESGNIDLGTLVFESDDISSVGRNNAKVYHYLLSEVSDSSRGGITFDGKTRDIYLSVYTETESDGKTYVFAALNDAGDITKIGGNASAVDETYVFTNSYTPSAASIDLANLGIYKNIIHSGNTTPTAAKFNVRIEPFNSSAGEVPPGFGSMEGYYEAEYNAAVNGEFKLTGYSRNGGTPISDFTTVISYPSAGKREYLIREVNPAEDGIEGAANYTYDTLQYKLVVEITDNNSGQLQSDTSLEYRSSLSDSWKPVSGIDSDHKVSGASKSLGNAVFANSYGLEFTLTYNTNGALQGGNDVPAPKEYNKGASVELYKNTGKTLARNEHEVFVGWSRGQVIAPFTAEEGEEAKSIIINSVTVDRNTIVYAVWAVDADGNGIPDYDDEGFSVRYYLSGGASDVIPNPSTNNPDRFYICGHNHILGEPAEIIMPDENGKFTVIVNGEEQKATLTKPGAVFIGWSKNEQTGNVESLAAAGQLEIDTVTVTDNAELKVRGQREFLDLYAVWADDVNGDGVPDYLQVKYNANPPAGASESSVMNMPNNVGKYEEGDTVIVEKGPYLVGYTFAGWGTEPAGGEIYQPGETFTKSGKADNLYAQWTVNEQSLIIQVYDDANNNGAFDGDSPYESVLRVSKDNIVLTNTLTGETITGNHHSSGGVEFLNADLPSGMGSV